jgi:hypothetical protein
LSKASSKGPQAGDLQRMASAQMEKQITAKAKAAALPHGGVTVVFKRKADGTVASVDFQGTDAAVEAAKATLG